MADTISYDNTKQRLLVGAGHIDYVTQAMWDYSISGKQILTQWFSYRRSDRHRPLIGNKRPPSKLEEIKPDRWLPEYTDDLLNLLNVIGFLVDIESEQATLLNNICAGPTTTVTDLDASSALDMPKGYPTKPFRSAVDEGQLGI